MMMKNYYLVLGVPQYEQDPRGIRDAYRQLAKQYHPNRAGPEGATAFRDVVEAYEVLSHAEQRALHDQGLRRAEGRLDVAPDSIVLADDVPPEPLAPAPVSIPAGSGTRIPRRRSSSIASCTTCSPRGPARPSGSRHWTPSRPVGSGGRAGRCCAPGRARLPDLPALRGDRGDWLYSCPTCDDRGVVETEAPVRVHIPQRAWDGTILELPLRAVGIHNLHVRLHLRIDPLL